MSRTAVRANVYRLIALATGLLAFFLLRYPVRGFRVPMGPDAPVYMWWANLAKTDGLSVANWRPGAPSLTLMLGGTLGLSQLEVVAGLGAACAAAIGLASVELVRRGVDQVRPWVALLSGLLAGMFAVHLAGGYFGNIIFAALFISALALLAMVSAPPGRDTGPRAVGGATLAAALLLGAGGLAHPMFLVVGVSILLLALPFIRPEDRTPIWLAATGGAALTGAGLLTMFAGPRPLEVDTSADAFLRRAGFGAQLRSEFLHRLGHHWARYVPLVLLPVAWLGRNEPRPTSRRLLWSFAIVCLAGLAASFFISMIPGVRIIAFAFALPILAGLGLGRVTHLLSNRGLAIGLIAVLGGAMIWGDALTWFRERPYVTPGVVLPIRIAAEEARGLPADTPLVFVVRENDPDLAAFRSTNAGNVIRAYMPPERIADVHLYVGDANELLGDRPTVTGNATLDALSRTYLDDLHHAGIAPTDAAVYVLAAFNPGNVAVADSADGSPIFIPSSPPDFPDLPSSWKLVLAGIGIFLLLVLVGYGWAAAVSPDASGALALAACFGAAALILTGVVLDRLGLRLSGLVPPVASTLVGLGGYFLAWRRKRLPAPQSASEVDK